MVSLGSDQGPEDPSRASLWVYGRLRRAHHAERPEEFDHRPRLPALPTTDLWLRIHEVVIERARERLGADFADDADAVMSDEGVERVFELAFAHYFAGDYVAAQHFAAFAARRGHAFAARLIGEMLIQPLPPLARDEARGFAWLLRAAEMGGKGHRDEPLSYRVAEAVIAGEFVADEQSKLLLMRLLTEDAERGERMAQFTLAKCLRDGTLGVADHNAAWRWCSAASARLIDAQLLLIEFCRDGVGCTADEAQSRAMLLGLSEHDAVRAHKLMLAHWHGSDGFAPDEEQAYVNAAVFLQYGSYSVERDSLELPPAAIFASALKRHGAEAVSQRLHDAQLHYMSCSVAIAELSVALHLFDAYSFCAAAEQRHLDDGEGARLCAAFAAAERIDSAETVAAMAARAVSTTARMLDSAARCELAQRIHARQPRAISALEFDMLLARDAIGAYFGARGVIADRAAAVQRMHALVAGGGVSSAFDALVALFDGCSRIERGDMAAGLKQIQRGAPALAGLRGAAELVGFVCHVEAAPLGALLARLPVADDADYSLSRIVDEEPLFFVGWLKLRGDIVAQDAAGALQLFKQAADGGSGRALVWLASLECDTITAAQFLISALPTSSVQEAEDELVRICSAMPTARDASAMLERAGRSILSSTGMRALQLMVFTRRVCEDDASLADTLELLLVAAQAMPPLPDFAIDVAACARAHACNAQQFARVVQMLLATYDRVAIAAERGAVARALGEAYLSDGDDGAALLWFDKAKQHGDTVGVAMLGAMVGCGLGTKADPKRALALFRSGSSTCERCHAMEALCHLNGIGVPVSAATARQMTAGAPLASLTDFVACVAAENLYMSTEDLELALHKRLPEIPMLMLDRIPAQRDPYDPFTFVRRCVARSSAIALTMMRDPAYLIALMRERGYFTAVDRTVAIDCYESAAIAGNGLAMLRLGVLLLEDGDHRRALRWLRRAVELGIEEAGPFIGAAPPDSSTVSGGERATATTEWRAVSATQSDLDMLANVVTPVDAPVLAAARDGAEARAVASP